MRPTYGFQIIENCMNCPQREERLFCNLSPAAVERLSAITLSSVHPKDAMLFVEGQAPRGVFIICSGRVKLSTSAPNGKTLILRIAEPGEVLGLEAAIANKPYQSTAEVLEPGQANFIGRTELLKFLQEYGESALRVAVHLAENYFQAVREMKTVSLSDSAGERLVRFLVDWCEQHGNAKSVMRPKLTLTHQEMGQMIGVSRETVTRLLGDFKRRGLLEIRGSTLVIPDRTALEAAVMPASPCDLNRRTQSRDAGSV